MLRGHCSIRQEVATVSFSFWNCLSLLLSQGRCPRTVQLDFLERKREGKDWTCPLPVHLTHVLCTCAGRGPGPGHRQRCRWVTGTGRRRTKSTAGPVTSGLCLGSLIPFVQHLLLGTPRWQRPRPAVVGPAALGGPCAVTAP